MPIANSRLLPIKNTVVNEQKDIKIKESNRYNEFCSEYGRFLLIKGLYINNIIIETIGEDNSIMVQFNTNVLKTSAISVMDTNIPTEKRKQFT